MTTSNDVDLLLDRWLAEGAIELPDRTLDAALDTIEHTHQRRVLRLPWRNPSVMISMRLAAAAAVVVVVALGGAYLLRPISTQVAESPTPSRPVPTAPATALPTASSGPAPTLIPGTTSIAGNQKMTAGTTYTVAEFDPALSITAKAGWWLLGSGPGHAWFANGPNEPNPPDNYTLSVVVAAQVLEPGASSSGTAVPADLLGWLEARPDLALGAPQSVSVGGLHGTALQGTVRPGAATNSGGAINLICPAETQPCLSDQGGALGVGTGRPFELIVLSVRGGFVVIGMDGGSPTWAADAAVLDPVLAGLSFPGASN